MLRRLISFALVVIIGAAFVRVVLIPPEQCTPVTEAQLRTAATEAVGWLQRNQLPDGTWLYRYDRAKDEDLGGYHPVRHAGVTMALYQAAAAGIPDALPVADRGRDWALQRLYRTGDMAALDTGTIDSGATALLVAGLIQRRDLTGDTSHDADLLAMGRFLVGQIEPNGAVSGWFDRATNRPTVGQYQIFYEGETWWALSLLARTFPNEGFDAATARVAHYIEAERDDAERRFPPTSDHWGTYAMAETAAAAGLDETATTYAERVAGIVGMQVRWDSTRTNRWPNWWVRGRTGVPAGVGTLAEASSSLWLIAQDDARLRPLRHDLARRARCAASVLVERQTSAAEAARYPDPGRAQGAWFQFDVTQMDDQQHDLSALLRTIPVVQAGDGEGRERHWQTPVAWLLALLMLAAFNPLRGALRLRDVQPRWTLAGATASGLLAVVAGLLSDPLLDALNVSAASMRIAAGLLLAVRGVLDVIHKPRLETNLTRTWRDAVVPVAIPVTLRPAALVLALSAGADRGVGWIVLGALVAIALLAVPWPKGERANTVLRWAAVAVGAGLVVGGVILVSSGVLSI